jgi:hypothetical protein
MADAQSIRHIVAQLDSAGQVQYSSALPDSTSVFVQKKKI